MPKFSEGGQPTSKEKVLSNEEQQELERLTREVTSDEARRHVVSDAAEELDNYASSIKAGGENTSSTKSGTEMTNGELAKIEEAIRKLKK
ncbi:MAG: hypothetical protein WA057_01565 [Candidatus Magasanikiibacteriota bacterium]